MTPIERIAESLAKITIDIAEIRRDLAHHIRRTDLAEEHLEMIKADLKPVQAHVLMMSGALKLVGILAVLVTLLGGILKIFNIV